MEIDRKDIGERQRGVHVYVKARLRTGGPGTGERLTGCLG